MDIRILSGGGVNLDAHLSISDQDGTKMLSSDAKSQIAPSILTNEQWLLRPCAKGTWLSFGQNREWRLISFASTEDLLSSRGPELARVTDGSDQSGE